MIQLLLIYLCLRKWKYDMTPERNAVICMCHCNLTCHKHSSSIATAFSSGSVGGSYGSSSAILLLVVECVMTTNSSRSSILPLNLFIVSKLL
jgi:hypothetical protein